MKRSWITVNPGVFLFPAIAILAFFTGGCNKEKNDPPTPGPGQYYFKAKLNGEQKDFMHSAQFQFMENNKGELVSVNIAGYDGKYDLSKPIEQRSIDFQLEIFRYDSKAITAGTYTEIGSTTSTYRIDGERHIQKRNDQGQTYTLQYDEGDLKDFEIVVTEVSKEKGIKGTFKGRIKYEAPPYDVITVTEGMFYFPYNDDLLNP